jgi:hypothetical protein
MPRLRAAPLLGLVVALWAAGCDLPGFPTGDDPEPAPGTLVFAIPADGATISAPVILTVQGEGIESVTFSVDGAVAASDSSAPFSWTLDPAAYGTGEHEVAVEAVAGGVSQTRTITLVFSLPVPGTPSGDIAADIADLEPGQWYEIPDSELDAVKPDPVPLGKFSSIVAAWSSGAYDTKRDRMIIWGGGHSDYSGNEVYAFSLKTFAWTRLTEPSAWGGDPRNPSNDVRHPDGRPVSRHTYDYIDYIPPPVDRFFSGGGGALWYSSFSDPSTYLFDFDALEWQTQSDCPSYGVGAVCAVGPDGLVWQHGQSGDKAVLSSYDAALDVWTTHARFPGTWFGNKKTAAIDPVRRRFVAIGEGSAWAWDLDRPDDDPESLDAGGATEIEGTQSPGFDYDPISGQLVAWNGGASVYSLDLETRTWTKRTTVGVGTTPPPAGPVGTYGHWRYAPSLNVFVSVNSTEQNVYVYRHSRP